MSFDASNRANSWAAQRMQAIDKAKQLKEERKHNLAKAGEMSVNNEMASGHLGGRVTSSENQQRGSQRPPINDFPLNSKKPATMKYGLSLYDQAPSEEELIQARNSLRLLKSKMNGFGNAAKGQDQYMGSAPMDRRQAPNYSNNDSDQSDNRNYRKVFKPSFKEENYQQMNDNLNHELNQIDKSLNQKNRGNDRGGNYGNYQPQSYDAPQQSRNRDNGKPPMGANKNTYDPIPNDEFSEFSSRNIPSRIPKNTLSANKGKGPTYDDELTSQHTKQRYVGNKTPIEDSPSRGYQNQQNYDSKFQQQKMQGNAFQKNNASDMRQNNVNKGWQNNHEDSPEPENNKVFSKPNLKKNMPPTNLQNQRASDNDFDNRQLKGNGNNIPDIDEDNGPLEECPRGCGRKFNQKALEKHAKVCQKVFQSKRPKFDSSNQRQTDEANELEPETNYNYAPKKAQNKKQQVNNSKSAKWKQQSEAFRANLRAARGEQLTQEEQVKLAQANQEHLVPCPSCGRKFSDQAATRHIPFCESKAKLDNIKKGGKNRK